MLDRHEYTQNPISPVAFWGSVITASAAAVLGGAWLARKYAVGTEKEQKGPFLSGPVLRDTPPASPLRAGEWVENFMVEKLDAHRGFGYAVVGEGSGDYLWLIQINRKSGPAPSAKRFETVEKAAEAATATIDANYNELTTSPSTPFIS